MRGALGSGGEAPLRPAAQPPLAPPDVDPGVVTRIVRFLLSILEYRATPPASNPDTTSSETSIRTVELDAEARVQSLPPDAAADATGGAVVSGDTEQPLEAGQSLVMSIEDSQPDNPQNSVLEFHETAGLKFRITTTDIYRRPIGVTDLDPANAAGDVLRFTIPLDAGQLIVTAFELPPADPNAGVVDPSAQGPVFGWTRTSNLIRIAPQTYLGDGITIHTEGSNVTTRGIDALDAGVARGDDIIRENQVGSGTDARSGWFQTQVPATCRTLAVTINASEFRAREGTSTVVEVAGNDGQTLRLQPTHVFRDVSVGSGQFILLYHVPAGVKLEQRGGAAADAPADQFTILTRATGSESISWEIQGVSGIVEDCNRVRLNWDKFRLRSRTITTTGSAPNSTPNRARLKVVSA
jgi:hypothetical protein